MTWTGTVKIGADVTVPYGIELDLDSGANVEATSSQTIIVNGIIDANGATFTGSNFQGVKVYNEGWFEYCDFDNVYKGIESYNCDFLWVYANLFENSTYGILSTSGANYLDIYNNDFDDLTYSINITGTSAIIEDNDIYNTSGHRGINLAGITAMDYIENNSIEGDGGLFRGVQIISYCTENAQITDTWIEGCDESCVYNQNGSCGKLTPDNVFKRDGDYSVKNLYSGYTVDAQNNTWYDVLNYGPVNTAGGTFYKAGTMADTSEVEQLFYSAVAEFNSGNKDKAIQDFKSLMLDYYDSEYAVLSLDYIMQYFEDFDKKAVKYARGKKYIKDQQKEEKKLKLRSEALDYFIDVQNQLKNKKSNERLELIIDAHILYWLERNKKFKETEEKYNELIAISESEELEQGLLFAKAMFYIHGLNAPEKAIPLLENLVIKNCDLSIDAQEELYCLGKAERPEHKETNEFDSKNGKSIVVSGNYPNPFNPQTQIQFALPETGKVSIKIYDIRGREVVTLLDSEKAAGQHVIKWDGLDQKGLKVASGMYFYRINYQGMALVKKMMIVR